MKISPNHIFISTDELVVTYGQLGHFSDQIYQYLGEVGFSFESDRVAIMAKKDLQTALIISSCILKQIPFTSLPSDVSSQKLEGSINESGAGYYFRSHVFDGDSIGLISVDIPSTYSNLDIDIIIESKDYDSEKLFAVLFTSGTTTDSKAVPIKFRQLVQAVKSSETNLPLIPTDEWLLNLPLHHIGGISVLARALFSGSMVYLSATSDSESLSRALSFRDTLSYASLVPTQLKRLLDDPDFEVHSVFKAILLGGGPISKTNHLRARQRGIRVIPSFGMTETTAQCIAVPLNSWDSVPLGTSGRPLPGIEVSLRPDSADDQDNGTLMWLKGPQLFDGYIRSELNREAFDQDGWFNTGDFATMDENGFIFIEMRRSDRIVTGGENVNPFVVEDALESLPQVKEAAVFGLQDEEWGQILCACVVFHENNAQYDTTTLQNVLKNLLPGFMVPKRFIRVDSLPRTKSGKLIRAELQNIIDDCYS